MNKYNAAYSVPIYQYEARDKISLTGVFNLFRVV